MHAALVEHSIPLSAAPRAPQEEAKLARLTDVIEAYEAKRWPSGKVAAGKGEE